MEDFGERTLPPSERRRREARFRGQVPRSADLTSALLLLATTCLLWYVSANSTKSLTTFLRASLMNSVRYSDTVDGSMESIASAGQITICILGPVLLISILAGLMGNFVQTGWLWNVSQVAPRIRWRGVVSWNSAAGGIFSVLRLAVLGVVAWRYLMSHQWPVRSLGHAEPATMLAFQARFAGELCLQLAGCLVIIALADYGFQFWRNEQNLMMTVEERRREQREENTNPEIKKRRADRRRQLV